MLTRCPSCATHFRVTAEQLKLRSGRVRCGECQHVFNALDTLIEEPPPISVPVAAVAPEAVQRFPIDEISAPGPAPDITPVSQDDESDHVAVAEDAQAETAVDPVVLESPSDEVSSMAEADSVTPAPDAGDVHPPIDSFREHRTDDPEPPDESYSEPIRASRRWPWAVGGLLAILGLGLQATLTYRVEMAVLWPESRPLLVAMCQALGCDVGLPAKVALVGIEASDLHPDTAQKGRLILTATLKNRAPFPQQFPHLELTLTDTADKPIVRKVMAAADYLPRTVSAGSGMMPNADVTVSVTLDAGELPASGYRLYIFYP